MIINEKETNETAKQYALRVLLNSIVSLQLKPGEKIIEAELCEQFKLSRTPIREAILDLNHYGLIDIYPKQGTYVSLINSQSIYEFIEFRSVIEGKLSQIACEVMTEEHIEHLKELFALWACHANNGNRIKMHYYDKEFHKHIYNSCNKQYWYHILSSNMYQFDRVIMLMQEAVYNDLSNDHQEIIRAIETRDKESAYNITVAHVTRFNDFESILKKKFPEFFVES